MHKIIFVEGLPCKGFGSFIMQKIMLEKKCKEYKEKLNSYFEQADMDWKAESAGSMQQDFGELFQSKCQMFLFVPGGQMRFSGYQKELKENSAYKYYLTETELYTSDIEPVLRYIWSEQEKEQQKE